MHINSVSSVGIRWNNQEAFEQRLRHEIAGVAEIVANSKRIHTIPELYAFLLLGPHRGFREYLWSDYNATVGGGWL